MQAGKPGEEPVGVDLLTPCEGVRELRAKVAIPVAADRGRREPRFGRNPDHWTTGEELPLDGFPGGISIYGRGRPWVLTLGSNRRAGGFPLKRQPGGLCIR